MNENTLLVWDDGATLSFDPGIDDLRDRLIREGVLVPVLPCTHGKLDGHMVTHFNTASWCRGAGIGGDDGV